MSNRLTNKDREKIINNVMNGSAFEKRKIALRVERTSIHELLMNTFISESELNHAGYVPEIFINRSAFEIYLNNSNADITLNKRQDLRFVSYIDYKETAKKTNFISPVYYGASYRAWKNIDSKLQKRIIKFVKKINDLYDDKKNLKRELEVILASVTTKKKLLEVWPEGSEFLPKESESIKLPVKIDTSDLNNLIKRSKSV